MKPSYVSDFLSHSNRYFGGPLSHHVSGSRLLNFGLGNAHNEEAANPKGLGNTVKDFKVTLFLIHLPQRNIKLGSVDT